MKIILSFSSLQKTALVFVARVYTHTHMPGFPVQKLNYKCDSIMHTSVGKGIESELSACSNAQKFNRTCSSRPRRTLKEEETHQLVVLSTLRLLLF